MTVDKKFLKALQEIDITSYLDYRLLLEDLYQAIKRGLNSYSYISYCQDLGLGTSNMVHLCIRGKRHLRSSSIIKISQTLGLKNIDRQYLETLHQFNRIKQVEKKEPLMKRLLHLKEKSLVSLVDRCHLEYYSEWFHPVVREMITCHDFDGTPQWIAAKIYPKITLEQAKSSLILLQNLGFIKKNKETGQYRQTQTTLILSDNIESLSVVRYHQRVLDLAKNSLTEMSEKRRDIRAITMSVSHKSVEEIKLEIINFQNRILEIARKEEHPETVVQLNTQLFPFLNS